MNDDLRRRAALFDAWLQSPGPAEPALTDLLALDAAELEAFMFGYSLGRRFAITSRLLEHAHALLSRRPKDAVAVASLASHFGNSLVASADGEDMEAALALSADSEREAAHACLTIGDYERAGQAAKEASFLYALAIASLFEWDEYAGADREAERGMGGWTHVIRLVFARIGAAGVREDERNLLENATILGLIEGQILHGLGETDAGLLLLEQASNMLGNVFGRHDKYIEGRLIYGAVLLKTHRFGEALERFLDTAAVAKELKDDESLAHCVNNVGVCYYYLGQLEKAKECAETAAKMFEELGLVSEAIRPRNMLATLLIEASQYHRAVPALYMNRNTFLSVGLPNDAARVMLKIVRALVLAGRTSEIDWPATIETFARADGIRSGVIEALEYLSETATQRPLLVEDVQRAERMLDRIDDIAVSEEDAG